MGSRLIAPENPPPSGTFKLRKRRHLTRAREGLEFRSAGMGFRGMGMFKEPKR
jgi:hypothetical protein